MPYPTSFMPDLNAIDYLLHARGLLCSWLGSFLLFRPRISGKMVKEYLRADARSPCFPLRGAGKNPHGGWTGRLALTLYKDHYERRTNDDEGDVSSGDVLYPKRTKYSKNRKGRCSRGCKPDAIEAARRAIIGQFRRNGKIWVRVLADLPITGKPTEIRMGRGKGNPTGWIARVSTDKFYLKWMV
uniref:Large ribosomal subunit protein uL16m n=1 Tax=Salix viminalis TaxID=40686 RepID=A0A6N2MVX5_SALVM